MPKIDPMNAPGTVVHAAAEKCRGFSRLVAKDKTDSEQDTACVPTGKLVWKKPEKYFQGGKGALTPQFLQRFD